MDRKEVAPFALTYQWQMTGEIGYMRQEGYKFWHVFAEQDLRRFGPTDEAEKSLREMASVKYRGDVAKSLMEMENLNIHARVTGIAWRKMIEDELPVCEVVASAWGIPTAMTLIVIISENLLRRHK